MPHMEAYGELVQALAQARNELADAVDGERARTRQRTEAFLGDLRLIEDALVGLSGTVARLERTVAAGEPPPALPAPQPRFARVNGHQTVAGVPPGAVLIATRLARDGYSRSDVESFLDDSFRHIDVPATIDVVFASAELSKA